ncbi:glycosyltransferase [Lacibacter luteus]|uniref:Glycosyltransferase n=1 Tax=Lacibacter luteus TaxID=2508719 RepID=A0A4Q1CD71_9BACT|nr:glycosyltransferase family 4 protein [Lacibacter luteus]RXK57426.1 glycosyltransferase [Lacibacter luteus]
MNDPVPINDQQEKPLIVWQAHEGNLSGANIAMLEYIDALRGTYRFHVILPHEGTMRNVLTKRQVTISIVPQYGWADSNFSFKRRLKRLIRTQLAVRIIRKLLKETGASFVFTNTLVPFVAAKAAYRLQLPHVWWIHEYGEEDFGFRIGYGKPEKAYKQMQHWSKLIICNSEAVTTKFKALLPNVPVHRIYQPVSWNAAKPVPKDKIATYLMFGQLAESKGHLEVLKAVAKAKQLGVTVKLHIKGPSENAVYLHLLKEFISTNQLEEQINIETGFFVKEEIMPQYEVLIVASRSEAFGRVIVEANKAGLRVLVRNSGGAPELINETNGLLYTNQEDLEAILCGERAFPDRAICCNYNESEQIQTLTELLERTCM